MPTITISNTAGDYDYSVMDLNFKKFLNEDFSKFAYNSDKHGVQHLTLIQSDHDFLSMTGSFKIGATKPHNRLDAVVSIDSVSVGHGDNTYYSITDVDLRKADLKTDKTLAAYVNEQAYTINGNSHDNILAGGLRGDELYGNNGNDELYGNNGRDRLFGGNSSDILSGGNQDDALDGGAGNDKLEGGDGNDKLNGGDGNDKLAGGEGRDVLIGGDGNDIYLIDADDKITEDKGKSGGTDTVVSASNADLSQFSNVEDLVLIGNKDVKGFGNAGDNDLTGNSGDNKLDGGKGADTMIGGDGDDTYVVDNKKDTVIETGKRDHDTIDATVSVDISKLSNIEDVFLFGKDDIDATGNKGDNHLRGNDGDNTLWGHKGDDELTGGRGSDHFIFAKGDDVDTIVDFTASGKGHDVLELDGFGKIKFSQIEFEKHGKNGIEVDFGHGDTLIFEHVKIKDFDIHDFQF